MTGIDWADAVVHDIAGKWPLQIPHAKIAEALRAERQRAAQIAEFHVPSSPSAAEESAMRKVGPDIAHRIRDELRPSAPKGLLSDHSAVRESALKSVSGFADLRLPLAIDKNDEPGNVIDATGRQILTVWWDRDGVTAEQAHAIATVVASAVNLIAFPVAIVAAPPLGEEGSELVKMTPGVITVLPDQRDDRQRKVAEWCAKAFGIGHAESIEQRGVRFLEEAIETAQACGVDIAMAHKLLDFVYARPAGKLHQELGGVGVTLLALAHAAAFSADGCEQTEWERVQAIPLEHFHKRNQSKNAAGFDTTQTYPVKS